MYDQIIATMMPFIKFALILFGLRIIGEIIIKLIKTKRKKLKTKTPTDTEERFPYARHDKILTNNEYKCYKNLKIIADKYGFEIFGKVRFADIVKVTQLGKDYMAYFAKIKAKHVDFVLLDSGMNIKLIIELDDWSHDSEDRIERDKFVDKVCEVANVPILHIRVYTIEELENQILQGMKETLVPIDDIVNQN